MEGRTAGVADESKALASSSFLNRSFSGSQCSFRFSLHRHVVDQASRTGPVRDFHRRDRLLPRPHALQPVAVVILALVAGGSRSVRSPT